MRIQYLGYEHDPAARVYLFRVAEVLHQDRHFKLRVKLLLLEENKFKIQDLPDLCFSRLKRELVFETHEQVVPPQIEVSDSELREYIEDHYPQKVKHGRKGKPQEPI